MSNNNNSIEELNKTKQLLAELYTTKEKVEYAASSLTSLFHEALLSLFGDREKTVKTDTCTIKLIKRPMFNWHTIIMVNGINIATIPLSTLADNYKCLYLLIDDDAREERTAILTQLYEILKEIIKLDSKIFKKYIAQIKYRKPLKMFVRGNIKDIFVNKVLLTKKEVIANTSEGKIRLFAGYYEYIYNDTYQLIADEFHKDLNKYIAKYNDYYNQIMIIKSKILQLAYLYILAYRMSNK